MSCSSRGTVATSCRSKPTQKMRKTLPQHRWTIQSRYGTFRHPSMGGDNNWAKICGTVLQRLVCKRSTDTHTIFHVSPSPLRPVIDSGWEDGTFRLWHSNTYCMEQPLNYGFDRCWLVTYLRGSNIVVFDFDEGTMLIEMGKDVSVASMDTSGKVIIAVQRNLNRQHQNDTGIHHPRRAPRVQCQGAWLVSAWRVHCVNRDRPQKRVLRIG